MSNASSNPDIDQSRNYTDPEPRSEAQCANEIVNDRRSSGCPAAAGPLQQ
jgi:hypothetical protein